MGTKMFTYNGKKMRTWSPFTGCEHECIYCWAKSLVATKLKDSPKYKNGFKPTFHPNELNKKFKPDEFVFVSSMGDVSFCPLEEFDKIMTVIEKFPQTNFLLLTKNPDLFSCGYFFPKNIYFGVTLETNRDTSKYSKARSPESRYLIMRDLVKGNKFVSIEPIMDFDLDVFSQWILDINPKIIEVGADNYHNSLPEPSSTKIKALIKSMEKSGIEVICKEGLYRLLKDGK